MQPDITTGFGGMAPSEEKAVGVQAQPATEEKTSSEANSEFVDISHHLPSSFMFYQFDSLSIRRFKYLEMKKVASGVISGNVANIVEAISACLPTNGSAYDLTDGDFWFLMYWQRVNSYKKNPYTLEWDCSDIDHLSRVFDEDDETTEDSLHNVSVLSTSENFQLDSIDQEQAAKINAKIQYVLDTYGVNLWASTVRDTHEATRLKLGDKKNEKDEAEVYSDDMSMIRYASHISRAHGRRLVDRLRFLNTMNPDPDFLCEVDEFINLINHGVHDTVTVRCKECNKSKEVPVSFDLLTFFPHIHRAGPAR